MCPWDTHKGILKGVKAMYKNLRDTLRAENITIKSFSEFLGVSEKNVQNKINQETEFTLKEFQDTCNFLLPKYNPGYLFATDSQI